MNGKSEQLSARYTPVMAPQGWLAKKHQNRKPMAANGGEQRSERKVIRQQLKLDPQIQQGEEMKG